MCNQHNFRRFDRLPKLTANVAGRYACTVTISIYLGAVPLSAGSMKVFKAITVINIIVGTVI